MAGAAAVESLTGLPPHDALQKISLAEEEEEEQRLPISEESVSPPHLPSLSAL
jgi:hypothetical protein